MSGGVPVFVMLPLDTVNADGVFAYASIPWFTRALSFLSSSGVKGVAIDCWWGAVEKKPKQYDFSAYRQVCKLVKKHNLRLQVVMSFHACGSNVNDTVSIPLPEWVLEAGKKEPDMFFMDRPRDGNMGRRNRECVSFFADDVRCLDGRTPLECYHDMMAAFASAMGDMIGSVIEEVVVGTGPCGELRYPSYVESNGWKFPGIGEFQCYDRRALASLARAAQEAGHPEWGHQGPEGVGQYNNLPQDTNFFTCNGGWQTPQGDFFLNWYSAALILHGQRVLEAAVRVFYPYMYADTQQRIRERGVVRTDDLGTSPPPCHRVESDAGLWQSEPSMPSELGTSTRLEGAYDAPSAPPRAVSPNPTHVSSVHSQRSLPTGLCDLEHRYAGPTGRVSDSAGLGSKAELDEGVPLDWVGASPRGKDAAPGKDAEGGGLDRSMNHHSMPGGSMGRSSPHEGPPAFSLSSGGLHGQGSARNMLWKSPRGGEMPALPESEPLQQSASSPHRRHRGGFSRGGIRSDPTLGGASGEGGHTSGAGAHAMESPPVGSPRDTATLASTLERVPVFDARPASDDDRECGNGVEVAGTSMPTSCSSSFMSVASATDLRRESQSLLMSVKIAGVHWWYHTPSHAAELTAGYYNSRGHNGYEQIIRMCADHGAGVILTCVEMSDAQHPPEALCGPEALLRQVRVGAHLAGLQVAGENALPCISRHGVNAYALEHIVKNTHAHYTIPRRSSDYIDRSAVQQPFRSYHVDRSSWKPSVSKAFSSDGHIMGGPAPLLQPALAVAPSSGVYFPQTSPGQASSNQAMRKATSWIDLTGHDANDAFWGQDNTSVGTPLSSRLHRSNPKNDADDAWPMDEGHLTMPYSMGSNGDLLEAASGGGGSAPLSPLTATRGVTDSGVQFGGGSRGLMLASRQTASGSLPLDIPPKGDPADSGALFLPPMRMFTFLRMCPEMLNPGNSGQWLHFMRRMHSRG